MTGQRITARGRTQDRDPMAVHRAHHTPFIRTPDPLLMRIERRLAPIIRRFCK